MLIVIIGYQGKQFDNWDVGDTGAVERTIVIFNADGAVVEDGNFDVSFLEDGREEAGTVVESITYRHKTGSEDVLVSVGKSKLSLIHNVIICHGAVRYAHFAEGGGARVVGAEDIFFHQRRVDVGDGAFEVDNCKIGVMEKRRHVAEQIFHAMPPDDWLYATVEQNVACKHYFQAVGVVVLTMQTCRAAA